MLSLYSTLSLRYLRRRWLRAALVVASIALGITTLVATRALNETMTSAGLASLNPMAGTSDLLVGNGEAPVGRDLAPELTRVPGVAAALPRVFRSNTRIEELKDGQAILVGIDPDAEQKALARRPGGDTEAIDFTPSPDIQALLKLMPGSVSPGWLWTGARWLRAVTPLPPVVVGKGLAERLPPGRNLHVYVPGRKDPAAVMRIGTVDGHGPLSILGGDVLLFLDLDTAARMAGLKKGQVTRIDLVLDPGASVDQVKAAVARRLAGRAEVHTFEEKNQVVSNAMAGMQTGFSLCGLAALVVALFLVYNALSVSVAERRHEIGILLSVGATRGQIRALFGGEAALLGLAGSALGIPLGLGLAYVLQPLVKSVLEGVFLTFEAKALVLSPWLVVAALVSGVLTAVAACVKPAMDAASEKPAEAVRRVPPVHTLRGRVAQAAASALLVAAGALMVLLRAYEPPRLGLYGGMVLVLLGTLLATPLFAAAAARLLQPVGRRLFGIEARLAADNLVRSPQRTGLVIAALAAGVSLVMLVAGTTRSNREGLHDWVRDSIGCDLIVMSGSLISGQNRLMPADLAQQIEKIPGVEAALPLASRRHPFRDAEILVEAVKAGPYARANARRHIKGLDLYRALASTPDGAIVSENFAAQFHVRRGDTITLTGPHGPVRLRVLGWVVDYSWNRGTLIVNWPDFARNWDEPKADSFDVYLRPGANVQKVQEAIPRLGAEYGLLVQRREQLQDYFDQVVDQLYGVTYALLVMVMVVAALGVVMAFLISVLQRRREMGLLRAIGASQAQVVYSVLAEAAFMGLIGTAIGLAVGVPLEWFVLRVAFFEESGYLFAVHIPWTESLVIAGAALLMAVLAGLGPAVHSVRQRIPEAIAYE